MNDLLVRNVALPDGRVGQDLPAIGGRIAGVGPALAAPPGIPVLEGQGQRLAPPFVDARHSTTAWRPHAPATAPAEPGFP